MVKYLFWNREHTAAAPAVELRFQEGGPKGVEGNLRGSRGELRGSRGNLRGLTGT